MASADRGTSRATDHGHEDRREADLRDAVLMVVSGRASDGSRRPMASASRLCVRQWVCRSAAALGARPLRPARKSGPARFPPRLRSARSVTTTHAMPVHAANDGRSEQLIVGGGSGRAASGA